MLQNLQKLLGWKLGAADGDIGRVKDFYFDDRAWAVRYLLADTGSWLPGRQIVFAPPAFGFRPFGISPVEPDVLRVSLNRKKIEDGPFVEAHRPLTREDEEAYYDYHRLQVYWRPGNVKGEPAFPTHVNPAFAAVAIGDGAAAPAEAAHLHSVKAMTGYRLCATDGAVGTVRALLADDKTWAVVELVVETGPWYASRRIVVRPATITRVAHEERAVFVSLTRLDIRRTMRNDVAVAGAGYR